MKNINMHSSQVLKFINSNTFALVACQRLTVEEIAKNFKFQYCLIYLLIFPKCNYFFLPLFQIIGVLLYIDYYSSFLLIRYGETENSTYYSILI